MEEPISPDELEELKAIFQNFNTDEKKVISRKELEESLEKLGTNLGLEEVKLIAIAVRILQKVKSEIFI